MAALEACQADPALTDKLEVLVHNLAKAQGKLFPAIKLPAESPASVDMMRRAMDYLAQALTILQDIKNGGQATEVSAQAIASSLKTLHPVVQTAKEAAAKLSVPPPSADASGRDTFNVNVNTICPGIIYTPMWEEGAKLLAKMDPRFKDLDMAPKDTLDFVVQMAIPFKRYQTAEDIGNTAVFLASDEAKEITGQAINVCGGMHFA